MSARVYGPAMVWQPIPGGQDIMWSLSCALTAWRGTPYESGQSFKQLGADCIGAVFGVIDELDGRFRARKAGMPADTSMHSRAKAIAAVRELARRYTPCSKVEPVNGQYLVEPGDIVVTGPPGGGPGHVELVGASKNELWHAVKGSGFHQGGWSLLDVQILFGVYRLGDKERWAR